MNPIRLSHPRRTRLLDWLESGEGERITEHVEHCERCARVLEELSSEQDVPAVDDDFGDAIRVALAPPDDLSERVLQRIEARRMAEREVSLFLGLFSIPRDAVDLMMPQDRRPPTTPRPPVDPAHTTEREELE